MTVEQLEVARQGTRVYDRNGACWEKVNFGTPDEWESDVTAVDSEYPFLIASSSEMLWNAHEPIKETR